MFVNVMRARSVHAATIHSAWQQWAASAHPGADGFLGSTAGVATDGQLVLVARFTDAEAAGQHTGRDGVAPGLGMIARAASPLSVFESDQVDVSMGGGSDDAGFVQLLFGRGDRERARDLLAQGEDILRRERPDIIGGFTVWRDGTFVDVAYFRSEDEARAGESRELSAQARAWFEDLAVVMSIEEFVDLPDPWFL